MIIEFTKKSIRITAGTVDDAIKRSRSKSAQKGWYARKSKITGTSQDDEAGGQGARTVHTGS